MTTYNTGNPIGSTEVKDLYDNAQNFDVFANSTTLESSPDRFGVERLTIHGFEEEAKRLFESIKFQPPIPYAPGIEVTTSSLTVDYLGVIYYALPSALPFTTGAWNPAQWSPLQNTVPGNELLVFDDYATASAAAATLPDGQLIESPNADGRLSRFEVQASALVFKDYAPDVIRMTSYAALRAYAGNSPVVDVTGTGVAGRFAFDPVDTTTADNGGTVIVDAGGRRWKRLHGSVIERAWFETSGAFDTFSASKPRVDSDGALHFPVTVGGVAQDIADAVVPVVHQSRCRINYKTANSVSVFSPPSIAMGGFRFAGNYMKGRAPVFANTSAMDTVASFATNLGVETADKKSNWYAVFAVANDGDTSVQIKLMPFFRAGTVTGSNVAFTYGGEGPQSHALNAITYAMANNALANCDCLVINEGSYQAFKGRATKVTANTNAQLTLQDVGTVATFNYLLVAPPGFKHYAYLGSVYMDTAEPRNLADTGSMVGTRGITVQDPNLPASGAIASPGLRFNLAGYISPLATAAILDSTISISTSSTGSFAQYFSHDSSDHVIENQYFDKQSATTTTTLKRITLPFSIGQMSFTYTGGALQASRSSATLLIQGFIEP